MSKCDLALFFSLSLFLVNSSHALGGFGSKCSSDAKEGCLPICKFITEELNKRAESGKRNVSKVFKFKEARIMDVVDQDNKDKRFEKKDTVQNKISKLAKDKGSSAVEMANKCGNCCGGMKDAARVLQILSSKLEDTKRFDIFSKSKSN